MSQERSLSAAREHAINLLTYRGRSCQEIKQRLQKKGYPVEVIDEVVSWCQELGYLDDPVFARQWVETRLRLKPMGQVRLRWELAQKGVDEGDIDAALATHLNPDQEREYCRELGRMRWRAVGGPHRPEEREQALRRVGAFLQRRGFSAGLIGEVLRDLRQEDMDA